MAGNEVEVISHLLEVEQAAVALTTEAQTEADKRISAARAKADAEFKAEFDKIISDNERVFEFERENISADSERSVKEFKDRIEASAKDVAAFNSYLEEILFA